LAYNCHENLVGELLDRVELSQTSNSFGSIQQNQYYFLKKKKIILLVVGIGEGREKVERVFREEGTGVNSPRNHYVDKATKAKKNNETGTNFCRMAQDI